MTYPIEDINSSTAIDGLNYVLSGPSGLGQDFAGFSAYAPGYLTSNFRVPYTVQSTIKLAKGATGASTITVTNGIRGVLVGQTVTGPGIGTNATVTAIADNVVTLSVPNTADLFDFYVTFTPPVIPRLYVAPISLSTSEWLDPYTWKFTFATPEATPPFVPGNNITVSNVKTAAASPDGSTPTDYTLSGTKAVLGSETTYSNIFPTTLTGSGSGLELNITLTASGAVAYDNNNTSIERESRGSDYGVGDTLLIPGTSLGGTSPANDLTLTVVSTTSIYDGGYSPIGVVECTTTYVIARTRSAFPDPGPGTGGAVDLYNTTLYPSEFPISTDCNARVTVTGGTDRVFISAQLNNEITWEIDGLVQTGLRYTASINRYRGEPNNNPVNPGFVFDFDKRVAEKFYDYTLTGPGPGTINVETIFSTFVDADIPPGYYWYILDVSFQDLGSGDLQVTQSKFGLRSMSTQVVKQ